MGGMIPLTDASRRPAHFPIVTIGIILTNFFVFALELSGGDAFVLRWSVIPADIMAGHHWITILTAMFMHGSWSHIIGNMVFLWAFGPGDCRSGLGICGRPTMSSRNAGVVME